MLAGMLQLILCYNNAIHSHAVESCSADSGVVRAKVKSGSRRSRGLFCKETD